MNSSREGAIRFTEILARLDDAFTLCRSLGLAPERGRFGEYRRHVQRLVEIAAGGGPQNLSLRERERLHESLTQYRIALSESLEFGDLLPYLTTCDQRLLEPKLRIMLDGPPLPSDEHARSNVARNVQFELSFASMLFRVGFAPKLGVSPDVRIENPWNFLFECKRIFSPTKLEARIREAGEQLKAARKNHVASAQGIVVISLSRLVNPEAEAIAIHNRAEGKEALGRWIDSVRRGVEPVYNKLFGQSLAVAVFFYAASHFSNLETGRFDRGSFFLAEGFTPPFASYRKALDKLRAGLKTLEH